jgi:hypothetical protein
VDLESIPGHYRILKLKKNDFSRSLFPCLNIFLRIGKQIRSAMNILSTTSHNIYVIKNKDVGNTFCKYFALILRAGFDCVAILFVKQNVTKFHHEMSTEYNGLGVDSAYNINKYQESS